MESVQLIAWKLGSRDACAVFVLCMAGEVKFCAVFVSLSGCRTHGGDLVRLPHPHGDLETLGDAFTASRHVD